MRAAARLDRQRLEFRRNDSREAELFADALDQPAAMRAQFLAHVCGHDPVLRAEVESLLEILPAAREFFARRGVSCLRVRA